MLTYFKGRYNRYGPPDGQGYTLNEYFTYRLDEKHILLTTRHRAWVILDPQEYSLFLRHRVEERPELYMPLEDLGLILTDHTNHIPEWCYYYHFNHHWD